MRLLPRLLLLLLLVFPATVLLRGGPGGETRAEGGGDRPRGDGRHDELDVGGPGVRVPLAGRSLPRSWEEAPRPGDPAAGPRSGRRGGRSGGRPAVRGAAGAAPGARRADVSLAARARGAPSFIRRHACLPLACAVRASCVPANAAC